MALAIARKIPLAFFAWTARGYPMKGDNIGAAPDALSIGVKCTIDTELCVSGRQPSTHEFVCRALRSYGGVASTSRMPFVGTRSS